MNLNVYDFYKSWENLRMKFQLLQKNLFGGEGGIKEYGRGGKFKYDIFDIL
jgi:hypothetical protein